MCNGAEQKGIRERKHLKLSSSSQDQPRRNCEKLLLLPNVVGRVSLLPDELSQLLSHPKLDQGFQRVNNDLNYSAYVSQDPINLVERADQDQDLDSEKKLL